MSPPTVTEPGGHAQQRILAEPFRRKSHCHRPETHAQRCVLHCGRCSASAISFAVHARRHRAAQVRHLCALQARGSAQRTRANRRKMQVFARLAPGVTLQQARQEMDLVAKRLEEQNPTLNAGFGNNIYPVSVEDLGKELRRNLLVLLGAVGLILLLACANLANLILTRASARRKELAIRKSRGASRSRLVRQMVIESLVASFFGGLLALLVAYVGMLALLALKPADLQRPEQVHLSLPVLMFAMVVTGLAGILFGAIPALYVLRADAMSVLKQGTASQRSPARLRRVLVIGEVGLAVVLVIGAAFMIHSLVSAWRVDPGFRAEHVRTMHFSLPLRGMQ